MGRKAIIIPSMNCGIMCRFWPGSKGAKRNKQVRGDSFTMIKNSFITLFHREFDDVESAFHIHSRLHFCIQFRSLGIIFDSLGV